MEYTPPSITAFGAKAYRPLESVAEVTTLVAGLGPCNVTVASATADPLSSRTSPDTEVQDGGTTAVSTLQTVVPLASTATSVETPVNNESRCEPAGNLRVSLNAPPASEVVFGSGGTMQ